MTTDTHYYGNGPIKQFIGRLVVPVIFLICSLGLSILHNTEPMQSFWLNKLPLLAYAACLWSAGGVAIHAAQPDRMIRAFVWTTRWLICGGGLSYGISLWHKEINAEAFAVMMLGGTFTIVVRNMRRLKSKADGFV